VSNPKPPVIGARFPWWIGFALVAGLAIVLLWRGALPGGDSGESDDRRLTGPALERPRTANGGGSADQAGDASLLGEAIAARRQEVWVEFEAAVTKVLADDEEAPRHQRFLVRTDDGDSILVAHNIDVSDRVPVKAGQRIRLKGRYEWNDRGGVLHWTHRESGRGRSRGWIEVGGRRYE